MYFDSKQCIPVCINDVQFCTIIMPLGSYLKAVQLANVALQTLILDSDEENEERRKTKKPKRYEDENISG